MSKSVSPVIVAAHEVSARFGEQVVLKKATLNVHQRDRIGLIGNNGSGKSTLMKVLAGVYQKDSGEIEVDGKAVDIPDPHAAQALGIGIIHQELNLMNHLTVAQNIFIGREPMGRLGVVIDTPKMLLDTRAILDQLHLHLDPTTLVSDLTVAKQP